MFLEKYSVASEIRRIKLGLISGITATCLKEDGTSPDEQPHYESGGRKVLEDLADPESLIHKINPSLLERHKETIENARSSYPNPESRSLLLKLLEVA